ncbi:amidase [Cohaesibacter celericrescens]|nr:amidase [Cohaesibacter celericrescens]
MTQSPTKPETVGPVSLLECLKAINAGILTPQESIAGCLSRIEAYDAEIMAFSSLSETALHDATQASGPLSGIGMAVKDIFDTYDLPTECNSPIYHGHMSGRDAAIVAQARKAGSTLLGKSATTEFAFLQPGTTRNPHNLEYTPGGSSSGSAAAVAAGMAHLALGTQTGGSIIRPAAFCGVTGFKPSAGLLPKVGIKEFSWSLDTVGLFTATVADVAFAASVLTGRTLKIAPEAQFELPRLGIVRSHSWSEADPGYRQQFEDLIKSLKRFGVDLIDIEPSDTHIAAFHAHQIIQDYEARQALAWEYSTHPDQLSPLLKQTLDFAQTIKPSDYDEARMCAENASKEMDEHFEDVDALISLSAPGPAPKGLASTGSPIFNRIWTLFGLPAINIAGLTTQDGLPLGVQIIGPYMADQATLHIAHWLEGAIKRHQER